jgi:hypothetical protein
MEEGGWIVTRTSGARVGVEISYGCIPSRDPKAGSGREERTFIHL